MTDITAGAVALGPRGGTPWAVTWLSWPLLFAATLLVITHAFLFRWNLGLTLGVLTGGTIVLLVLLELLFPLDARWRMTWRSFFGRDIKYFVAGGVSAAIVNYAFALIGMTLASGHEGPITHWPLWLSIPFTVVAFDFFQYWQHRWSHEADTPLKRFLWRTHAPHHLPEQVYVLMHPAGHPLNFLLLQGLIRVPLFYVLGASAETLFAWTAITGLQGIISHCNVDLRAGWFNYLLTGTELHRFHHSADPGEAKNFAVTVSLIDLIFGTFRYEPGRVPARLGIADPDAWPRSNQFWRVMLVPFRRAG